MYDISSLRVKVGHTPVSGGLYLDHEAHVERADVESLYPVVSLSRVCGLTVGCRFPDGDSTERKSKRLW